MPQEQDHTFRFSNPTLYAGLTGVVDADTATIHGVSIITGNLVAEGHDLMVDGTCVQQLFEHAKKMGQIPVTLDHGAGISSINGFIDNPRMDGDRLRGDWHLLQTHDETQTMLERAERQPGTFGLSVAFKGPKEGVLHMGKKCARAEKLLSVDCVTRPAANPEGLFSIPDSKKLTGTNNSNAETTNFNMPSENQNQNPATLEQVLAAVQGLTAQVQAQQQVIEGLQQGAPQAGRPTLADLANASDEELIAAGYDVSEVRSVVDQAVQSGELVQEGGAQGAAGAEGAEGAAGAQGEMAGAAAGGTEGSAAFKALTKELIELRAKFNAREQREAAQAEEVQFEAIESKIVTLQSQRDEAVELAEGYRSEVEALRLAVRTGTRPARPGIDDGNRLMSANENGDVHQFTAMVQQLVAGGKTEGQAITELSASQPALKQDWLEFLAKGRK